VSKGQSTMKESHIHTAYIVHNSFLISEGQKKEAGRGSGSTQ